MPEGQVIKGRFGGVSAVNTTGENSPATSASTSSATGTPVTPGDVQAQLELVAHNARVAATRLIQIPPTGAVPKDVLESLLQTYVTIQGNIADVASRLGHGDVQKDAIEVQTQTQAFIDGVEAAIKTAQVAAPTATTSTTLAPVKREVPWLLIGAGGLGLLAIGIGVYQYQKSQVRASARALRNSRRPAFAAVAGTARKRTKKRKGRRSHIEE